MKYLSRKLFAVVLVVAVLSAGLALTACNNTYNNACESGHNFVLTSTTATCTESGTEFYSCANCKETKLEEVAAYGHNYNKNVCERCADTLTDLSQFSESYRNEMADKLLISAPHTAEMDTWVTSTRLLQEAVARVAECENKVAQAQTEYDNAIKQANESHSAADVSKATAAQLELLKAQSELKQAEADLKDSKTSYKYSCEGYAWNLAIVGIKASDTTNYAVNHSLEFLVSTEMAALDTATVPTWYSQIINSIKSITGIDIKTGA